MVNPTEALQVITDEEGKSFRRTFRLVLSSLVVLGLASAVVSCMSQRLVRAPARPSPTLPSATSPREVTTLEPTCLKSSEPSVTPTRQVMTLAHYPELFQEKTIVVVGESATHIEQQAADAIAREARRLTGTEPTVRPGSEVTKSERREQNHVMFSDASHIE